MPLQIRCVPTFRNKIGGNSRSALSTLSLCNCVLQCKCHNLRPNFTRHTLHTLQSRVRFQGENESKLFALKIGVLGESILSTCACVCIFVHATIHPSIHRFNLSPFRQSTHPFVRLILRHLNMFSQSSVYFSFRAHEES